MKNKTILGKCPGCGYQAEDIKPENWKPDNETCPYCDARLILSEITTKTVKIRDARIIKNEPR